MSAVKVMEQWTSVTCANFTCKVNGWCAKNQIKHYLQMEDQVNSTEEQPNGEDMSEGRAKLETWLNKSMRVRMTDGRTLVGVWYQKLHECTNITGMDDII